MAKKKSVRKKQNHSHFANRKKAALVLKLQQKQQLQQYYNKWKNERTKNCKKFSTTAENAVTNDDEDKPNEYSQQK